MRCPYCAARVERQAWFCPECKRSTRKPVRQATSSETRRGAARGVAALVVAGAATAFAGFLITRGAVQSPAPSETPEPRVRITALPASPTQNAPVKETLPSPPKPSEDVAEPAPAVSATPREAEPTPQPKPAPVEGTGAVTVMTVPPERTYVYLNGGTLLGETPLRNAPVPAGRHRLVFWTPAVQGRSVRTVEVEPGASVLVVEKVRAQQQFSDAGL